MVKLDFQGKRALRSLMQLVYSELLHQADTEYGNVYLRRLENGEDQEK